MTIMEYVMQKRMDKAERMLVNSDLSIREISEECGFPDLEYFSRCFKTIHGMSPSSWKKLYSQADPKKPPMRIRINALPVTGLLEPDDPDQTVSGERIEEVEDREDVATVSEENQ